MTSWHRRTISITNPLCRETIMIWNHVPGPLCGKPPVTGGFPAQRASNKWLPAQRASNAKLWWLTFVNNLLNKHLSGWQNVVPKSIQGYKQLTHWGRVTHICVSDLTSIGSDNGLSPGRRQAIIRTNAGILSIGPLGTNFDEISIGIQTFSLKKMHFKVSSAKWHPFCLSLNVLSGARKMEPPPPVQLVMAWVLTDKGHHHSVNCPPESKWPNQW